MLLEPLLYRSGLSPWPSINGLAVVAANYIWRPARSRSIAAKAAALSRVSLAARSRVSYRTYRSACSRHRSSTGGLRGRLNFSGFARRFNLFNRAYGLLANLRSPNLGSAVRFSQFEPTSRRTQSNRVSPKVTNGIPFGDVVTRYSG